MKFFFQSFLHRLKRTFFKPEAGGYSFEPDIRQKLSPRDDIFFLARTIEECTRAIESLVSQSTCFEADVWQKLSQWDDMFFLFRIIEERTRTIESLVRQSTFDVHYQIDLLQKLYVESIPIFLSLNQHAAFNADSILELKTDYPIAVGSHDHINPDSTSEGVFRPTFFVQNCISILGQDIKCLDLGSGAAGLVFEYAMNQVVAVGVDGSDFCRVNRIGYWPLLPNNLFTCDITKPFSFMSRDTQSLIDFDVITMWEVLEHIAESDLPNLFSNISLHLSKQGYFMGSISLVEYVDSVAAPYHVTLKPRDWWKAKFIECGLIILDTHPFNENFFCRGNGPRYQDFHNYAQNPNEGFLFVAQHISVDA